MRKRMLVFLTASVVVIAGIATVVEAQWHRTGPYRGHGAMTAQLELTDEQKEQMVELRKQLRDEMREAWSAGERPDRESMQALREKHREKMASILTEEQLEQLQALQGAWGGPALGSAHRGCRGHRGPGTGMYGMRQWPGFTPGAGPAAGILPQLDMMGLDGPGGMGCPFARLDLTEEQQSRLEDLRSQHREQAEALRAKHLQEMERVLTKEQQQELEALKDEVFYGGRARRGRKEPLRGRR